MIPIRVKGYLPRQVGSVIILPNEITTISGMDFDVDKVYMMYHKLEFKNYYDIKRAWDEFYRSRPDLTEAIEESKKINFKRAFDEFLSKNPDYDIESIGMDELFDNFTRGHKNYEWVKGIKGEFSKWFNPIKDRYLKSKSINVIEYEDTDIDLSDDNKNRRLDIYKQAKKNTRSQRNSMMVDLMYSVLTNPDTVDKMVNPGNFDEQKRTARIVNLLSNLSLDEINELGGIKRILGLSLKEANAMLEKYSGTVNPLTPDTWVSFQQRNMAGANLVPMAATQNVSHAITQLTSNFGLKDKFRFLFNGKRLGDLNAVKAADGKRISRNVSGYLAAFVDNAKDPVAGDLNINNVTANLAFLLLRIGNSPLTTGLILRQPAVMKIMKYVNSGKYSVDQAIEEAMQDYQKKKGNIPYGGKTIDFNFTDEWLASNIAAEKNEGNIHSEHIEEADFANNQIKVLVMIKQLNAAANALGDIVRSVRSDSQSGGPGGSIAKGNDKIDRLGKILYEAAMNPNYPLQGTEFLNELFLLDSEEKVVNSTLPIIAATFQYGLMATNIWYNRLFPQVSVLFRDMTDDIKGFTTYGNLDDTTVNKIYSQFLIYLMTANSNDFTGDAESREYFINQFPIEFAEFKSKNPYLVESLPLLRRLKVLRSNKYNGSPVIVFNNVGKVTDIQAEDFRSDFRNLLAHENTRDFAAKLLRYAFYRGLGFSPNGYSNLIPTQLKTSDATDYVKTLRDILDFNSPYNSKDFIYQYIRNNLEDRRFVPEVSSSGIFKGTPEDSFTVTVTKNSSLAMKKFAYPIEADSPIRYRDFVCYTYKGAKYYYVYNPMTQAYNRIKPLGSQHYQEYDFNSTGLMESVIKEPKKKGFNFRDDYRAMNAIESMNDQIGEEAYASMPDYVPPPISVEDLTSSREERAAQMEERFKAMDRFFGNPLTAEDAARLDAMERFDRLNNIEASLNDLDGNEKC